MAGQRPAPVVAGPGPALYHSLARHGPRGWGSHAPRHLRCLMFFLYLPRTSFPHDPITPSKDISAPKRSFSSAGKTFLGSMGAEQGPGEPRPGSPRLGPAEPGRSRTIPAAHSLTPPSLPPCRLPGRLPGSSQGKAQLPDHCSVRFLLPGAELEHRARPAHTVSSPGWLSRAGQGEVGPGSLCPQASTVLLPGKVFPAEEKLHLRAEIWGDGGMGWSHVGSWQEGR